MAHLLIIELAGGDDTDIIDAAIALGHEFSFLTSQLALYDEQPAVAAAISSAFERLEVPGFSYSAVEKEVLRLHAQRPIDAVICLIDIRLTEAARLASRLNLRYLNPASAALLRDKFSVRERLKSSGIAQPEYALATSNEALKMAVNDLGLPALVKPADGYGSQNIVVLRQACDLEPFMSPLENMLPSRANYGLGVMANDRLLVERYMEGSVIGCDTLTVNGQHQLQGVNEKLMFPPPSFAIRGGCYLPNSSAFSELEKCVFNVLDAVNFDWGATHIELMITPEGPRVIEINPRLVGAKIGRLISLSLGRSVHQDLINVHLGQWPSKSSEPSAPRFAVTRWITSPGFGTLQTLNLPEACDPLICKVELLKMVGDAVRMPFENADRIGCVMACGSDKASAEVAAERYVAETIVVVS